MKNEGSNDADIKAILQDQKTNSVEKYGNKSKAPKLRKQNHMKATTEANTNQRNYGSKSKSTSAKIEADQTLSKNPTHNPKIVKHK